MKFIKCIFFSIIFNGTLFGQSNLPLDALLNKAINIEDSSSYYFEKSKQLITSKTDSANFYYHKFYHKYSIGIADSANYFSEKVIPMLKDLDSLDRLRKVYYNLFYQELNAGVYEKALSYNQMALTLAEKLNDTARISLHYTDKSIIYHDFEDYERGIEYGKRAYSILDESSVIAYKYLIFANNAIAINFDDWGKSDSALFYHFKNLKLLEKVEDTLRYNFIYNNIGNTLLKSEQYEDSKKYISKALSLNKIRGRTYNLASNYTNLATIAYKTNKVEEAKELFKLAIENANKSKSIEKIRDVIEQELRFYKSIGDYKNAIDKQEQYYSLRDSIFNIERAASFAEMETRYETEKKEKEIIAQKSKIIEKELENKRKNQWIISGFSLALVLGLVGYLFYNKQKIRNHQLEKESQLKTALAKIETQNKLQEQRLRISRDLHDNIGAQLTFIISSLDNLKYKFPKINIEISSKLKTISDFTSQTIYELRDTIWAMNKEQISFEDLRGRITNFIEQAKISSHGIDFKFFIDQNIKAETTISSVKGMNLYRIIQEGVNNSIKYANPDLIEIKVTQETSNYFVSILDNGKGFDKEIVPMGNGFNNMEKRTRDISGSLSISSTFEKGTKIELRFPVY